MIYVVGVPRSVSAPVKIGSSNDLDSRLVALRRGETMPLRVAGMIGDPTRLDVLTTFEGDMYLERRLHAAFAERRIAGEWFYIGSSVKAVERIGAVVDGVVRTPMSPATPIDPITPLAATAAKHHEMYRAWVDAGFTDDQAIQLLSATLSSAATNA